MVYFDGVVLQVSYAGAAYVPIATGIGGGATLQTAYTAGATIIETGSNPVVIQADNTNGTWNVLSDYVAL